MPLRDDLLTPIPGDNPSGKNLRYDPETDKIKEARREELAVPQGVWETAVKTADYPLVVKLASELLAKRGKDLQIAVWLIDAQVRREGFGALAPCFHFVKDLLEQFWDTLYPEIEDGDVEVRAAPLEWLGIRLEEPIYQIPITSAKLTWLSYQESRLVGYETDADTQDKEDARNLKIKEGKLTAEQFDEGFDETPLSFYQNAANGLEDSLPALEDLIECCDTRFGNFSPSFLKTRKAIEDVKQTVDQLYRKKGGSQPLRQPRDEEIVLEESVGQGPDEDLSEPAAPVGRRATSAAAANGDIGQQLAAICAGLREKDPRDVSAYLIVRAYRWGELWCAAPPVSYSVLEPPPSEVRLELKRLFNNSDWKEVLDATEAAAALPCGRAWLDLHRYAVYALEQIGYSSAAAAVKSGLRALLQDLPDLLEASLLDDTPIASAETRAWIASDILPPPAAAAPPGEETPASESSEETPSDDLSSDFSSSSDDDTSSLSLSDDTPSAETSSDEPPSEPKPELPDPTFASPIEDAPPVIEASEIATDEPPAPDVFELAKDELANGNTVQALGLLSKKLANERSGRGRFRRRTQLAHLLMLGGHPKIAEPLLGQLAFEIEEKKLEEWEDTEALAYPLELLMRCLSSADEQRERKMQLYERICKLDPLRALNCSF